MRCARIGLARQAAAALAALIAVCVAAALPAQAAEYVFPEDAGLIDVKRDFGGWGNEAFQNHLMNFTVDVGRGNPGAVGVDFLASNRGAMEEITIRSGGPDEVGFCGLDMARPWPGPGLVKNVSVDGFDYGIRQHHMDCGMAFEHVTLTNQRILAIEAKGSPTMSMRGIVMAVSFADGGQKSYWTKIREIQDGQTKEDQTSRRETMMYIGGKEAQR